MSKELIKMEKRRVRKKLRIRRKVNGTKSRPRLTLYKSNACLYAQVVDDTEGITLVSASNKKNNVASAKVLGNDLGQKAKEKSITTMVFDRNGYKYHGVVKDFAEAIRALEIKI